MTTIRRPNLIVRAIHSVLSAVLYLILLALGYFAAAVSSAFAAVNERREDNHRGAEL